MVMLKKAQHAILALDFELFDNKKIEKLFRAVCVFGFPTIVKIFENYCLK